MQKYYSLLISLTNPLNRKCESNKVISKNCPFSFIPLCEISNCISSEILWKVLIITSSLNPYISIPLLVGGKTENISSTVAFFISIANEEKIGHFYANWKNT